MAYEVVMPYHLHMPSYFLETFTEYPYINKYMPTAYQKDGSIFKKLQELFLKSQGLFNEELSSVLITKKQELTR